MNIKGLRATQDYTVAIYDDEDFDYRDCVVSANGSSVATTSITSSDRGVILVEDALPAVELHTDIDSSDALEDITRYPVIIYDSDDTATTLRACGRIDPITKRFGDRYFNRFLSDLAD